MDLNIKFVGEKPLFNDDSIKYSSIEECVEYCKAQEVLGLDIETSWKFNGKYNNIFREKYGNSERNPNAEGLDPYLSTICMLQIGTIDLQYVIDTRTVDIESLFEVFEDPDIIKVGHNIKFEYKHIFHNYGIRLINLYDTMIVEQILFNGILKQGFGLKSLNERYLGITVDKDTRLQFAKIGSKPFTQTQISYGAEDILYPLRIRDIQLEDIDKKGVKSAVRLEMKFLLALSDIEYKGLHFNTKIWKETYNNNLIKFREYEVKLNTWVEDYLAHSEFVNRQLDLFSEKALNCKIKWTSSKQVISLFTYLDICPQAVSKTTKKLSYTVNATEVKTSLNTINKDVDKETKELLLTYLQYKELEQSCTTFGIQFFKFINPITQRLHSNYNQILSTGRISSRNPNLQNIPASPGFRKAFDCPDGTNIINADYSGQEQIILANKSKDPSLKEFYDKGHSDMHSFVTSKLWPEETKGLTLKEVKKKFPDLRQIAKGAGFAINYGGTGYTISKNLGVSAEKGDEVYNAYFKAFPGLKNYFKITQKTSLKRGYILIDPKTGRKYWFRKPENNKERGAVERTALNYPIQGEAGGITKYAAVLYRQWILEEQLEDHVFVTNLVHDEVNVEADSKYAEFAAKALEDCMAKAGDLWCKDIKLKAEACITTYWTH
jgi:DNA polymerase-1